LLLGVNVEHMLGDDAAAAAYRSRLKDLFPFSDEAQSLGK
jgi:Tfp pilus assembly protein PilF